MKNKNQTTIYLVRHGDVINPGEIIYGNLPLQLSIKGQKQAKKLAHFFSKKNINAIYSSPVFRCRQTATLISQHPKINLKIKTSQKLTESEWGVYWQGTPKDKMYQKFGADWQRYLTEPGNLIYKGITLLDMAKRMKKFTDKILKDHKRKNIVCVSHGDPIKVLVLYLQNRSMNDLRKIKLYYSGIIELRFNNTKLVKYKLLRKGMGRLLASD